MKTVTVEFEDQGQDFLEWDIEFANDYSFGMVKDSRPFQKEIWASFAVLSGEPKEGEFVQISMSPQDDVFTINYPVIKVTEK